jgi:hypothetical protein
MGTLAKLGKGSFDQQIGANKSAIEINNQRAREGCASMWKHLVIVGFNNFREGEAAFKAGFGLPPRW